MAAADWGRVVTQDAIRAAVQSVMPYVRATGLLVSLCTIKRPSGTQDAGGSPNGSYTAVAGLIDIPCTSPPSASAKGAPSAEVRGPADTFATQPHHVLLDRCYPQIRDEWMGTASHEGGAIATISSPPDFVATDYTLIAAEQDSQGEMTRLEIRLGKL